jgi:hypothetical protein
MAVSAMAQTYSGGDGKEGSPYRISSKVDMEALAAAVNGNTLEDPKAYFLLTEDVTGVTTVIGNAEARSFKGTFDGGGHVLDVTIDATGTYTGVFGYASGATIRNLGVAGSVASLSFAGGICGLAEENSSISNCYNTASISVSANSGTAGGICGRILNSSIDNCYNTGDISAVSSNYASIAGGICGYAHLSPVRNCFAANATVTATTGSGSSAHAGRIVANGNTTQENNYARADMVLTATGNGSSGSTNDGTAAAVSDFQSLAWLETNLHWVFGDEWYIPAGGGLPMLKAAAYAGGVGTGGRPYQISSVADMEALAAKVNGGKDYVGEYFLLTGDLTGITNIIGVDNAHPFKGTFDGGGHLLTVTISNTAQYVGVFGCANGATIKNLGVAGSVTCTGASGEVFVGGICGYMTNNGSITGCYNTASISGSASGAGSVEFYAGGICGKAAYDAVITNCYNTGSVSASIATVDAGFAVSGGICGETMYAIINNCYNTGTVSASIADVSAGSPLSGGICAKHRNSTISNCYNTGGVSASSVSAPYSSPSAGGICGRTNDGAISKCYNTGVVSASFASSVDAESYAGGICGQSDASISYCFAANASVEAIGDAILAGRIAGNDGNGMWSNNYALSGMRVNNQTPNSTDANVKDGCNMDIASFQSLDWLKSPLTWDMNNTWYVPEGGGYPELRANPALRLTLSSNNVTYGGTVQLVSSSPAWAPAVVYTSSNEAVAAVVGGVIQIKKVGTVTIGVFRGGTDAYPPVAASAVLSIGKAPLTITAQSKGITYGDPLPAYTFTYSGFVNGEDETKLGVLSKLPTISCTAQAESNAGGYSITVSGATADNYNITHTPGTLTIGKKSLTVKPDDASREYGDPDPTFTFSYEGLKPGEAATVIDTPPTAKSNALEDSPVGDNYTITCEGGADNNYTFTQYNTGTLTITQAPLTFRAQQTGGVSGTSNSMGIALTFSRSMTPLTADHIVLEDGTGEAVKGNLTGSGTDYTLTLTDVLMEGTVLVSFAHPGYAVTGNPQTVDVYAALHTLTVVSEGEGASGSGAYQLNDDATIDAGAAPSGQRFTHWTATPSVRFAQATAAVTTVRMPAVDVTVTAHFAPTYAVRIPASEGGVVTAEPLPVVAGERVTLHIAPENGYALSDISVRWTGAPYTAIALSGEGDTRTFTMPAAGVTVSASFHKTADRLALEEAMVRLGNASFILSQEVLNTQAEAFEWLLDTLNVLLSDLNISVPERNVWLYNFSPAIAGTPALPAGRAGGFAASVSLSRNGNYGTETVDGTILATRYVPVGVEAPEVGALTAYVRGGTLHVSGLAAGEVLGVYDSSGKRVYQGAGATVPLAVRGGYIVRTETRSVKVVY